MLNIVSANEIGSSLGTISFQSLMENQFVLPSFFSQYNINLKIPIFNAFHFLSVFHIFRRTIPCFLTKHHCPVCTNIVMMAVRKHLSLFS